VYLRIHQNGFVSGLAFHLRTRGRRRRRGLSICNSPNSAPTVVAPHNLKEVLVRTSKGFGQKRIPTTSIFYVSLALPLLKIFKKTKKLRSVARVTTTVMLWRVLPCSSNTQSGSYNELCKQKHLLGTFRKQCMLQYFYARPDALVENIPAKLPQFRPCSGLHA
jgi:hypothetical protein